MQYVNTVTDSISKLTFTDYKAWASKNVAYIAAVASGFYILKSGFDYLSEKKKEKSLQHRIAEIVKVEVDKLKKIELEAEKQKNNGQNVNPNENLVRTLFEPNIPRITNDKMNNSNPISSDRDKDKSKKRTEKIEFYYYVYFTCLHTIYRAEFEELVIKRRNFLSVKNFDAYYNYTANFLKDMKPKEQYLLRQVYLELGLGSDLDDHFTSKEVSSSRINGRYYENLAIDLPKELTFELTNEVLTLLFDNTKDCLKKILTILKIVDDEEEIPEKVYVIAEWMAFDNIFFKYNFNENEVRKAIQHHGLTYEIVSK